MDQLNYGKTADFSSIFCEAFGTAARTLPVGAHLAGPIRAGFTKPWVRPVRGPLGASRFVVMV